jgi:hypothetical protein
MLSLKSITLIDLFITTATNYLADPVDKLHLQTDASSQIDGLRAAIVLLVLWRAVAVGVASLTVKTVASLASA